MPLNSLIQMVSCVEILCWSFLESINYFSFQLVGVFTIFQFVLVSVLVGKVPLGLIYTFLFNWYPAHCINNSESMI